MSSSQVQKAITFHQLHQQRSAFVIPNPWDVGSALLLEGLGFSALATSSAASACAMGYKDGDLTRDQALEHARQIVDATDLPVSADLENGFGDSPQEVSETVRRAADVGLVGCTIEDSIRGSESKLYQFGLAVERIAAASETARALPFPFLLTARAHNYLLPNPSLDDTIKRLQAYEAVGAEVLFAPGLPDLQTVRLVCQAVSKPFNFMIGMKGKSFSIASLAEAGVRRISLATSLYRAAMTGLLEAVREITDGREFTFVDRSTSTLDLVNLMRR